MINKVKRKAAALAEYGLLLALIAIAAIAAISLLGNRITTMFNTLAGSI